MSLYETDFYTWARQQAELIRAGKLDQSEIENIAEEIESLGNDQADRVYAAYRLIAMHLLKLIYQPRRASRSWRGTITRERDNVERYLRKNPGLKPRRQELFAEAYEAARKEAASETGLALNTFPVDPPFTREQVEDDDFMPSA